MNKNDFEFIEVNTNRGYKDYYFSVNGASCNELSTIYDADGMQGIYRLAYTPETDEIALFRTFFFKEDHIFHNDEDLREMLDELVNEGISIK